MNQHARRVATIGILVLLLGLPLVIILIRMPVVSRALPWLIRNNSSTLKNDTYSVISHVPGVTVRLMDTQYLDFLLSKFTLFDANAVVDPEQYIHPERTAKRSTITAVRFELVPDVSNPIMALSGKYANSSTFWGKADYNVKDGLLSVRVSLDIPLLTGSTLAKNYVLEEAFIRMAAGVCVYARGYTSQDEHARMTGEIIQDIEKYLQSGLFIWPIRIEK